MPEEVRWQGQVWGDMAVADSAELVYHDQAPAGRGGERGGSQTTEQWLHRLWRFSEGQHGDEIAAGRLMSSIASKWPSAQPAALFYNLTSRHSATNARAGPWR
jgi:hypothetical protein